ncbi:hypothetical protein PHISCL_07863 [Aspergillus sclerotialis]|uniref:Uncharacterized protein n=1 Tax=Aspergillus sclerotialis TaxID=2070753 RepID=A0A3A2ZRY3_9EURO|nr:hypothetical protein PHISCL_07863 [Aspergillus sclerotialis]
MADPQDPTHKPEGPGNHPRTSTEGGASAYPTPANNVGGGSGWGDKGFFKGGSDGQGPGHENAPNPRATIGQYLGLTSQKAAAGSKNQERFDEAAASSMDRNSERGEPTCESEDHSFMQHRPGCPGTLPGWGKTKNAIEM